METLVGFGINLLMFRLGLAQKLMETLVGFGINLLMFRLGLAQKLMDQTAAAMVETFNAKVKKNFNFTFSKILNLKTKYLIILL